MAGGRHRQTPANPSDGGLRTGRERAGIEAVTGKPADLSTTAKEDLVTAINECVARIAVLEAA